MDDEFRRACPNMTSLNICSSKPICIPRFGELLTKLECRKLTYPRLPIPISCTNLRELTLGDHTVPGSNIWETIGGNLESLTLEAMVPVEELEKIQRRCRKIQKMVYMN